MELPRNALDDLNGNGAMLAEIRKLGLSRLCGVESSESRPDWHEAKSSMFDWLMQAVTRALMSMEPED